MANEIQALKSVSMERILDIDEAVLFSATARTLEREYETLSIPIPKWLSDAATIIREEIARRNKASLLAEMRKVEGELENLKTANERKSDAQRRLAVLQAKLGMTPGEIRSMNPKTESGRISDIVNTKSRSDWSELNAKLKAIEPGSVETITCPVGISLSALRSTLITNGRRFHKGDWRFTTRTEDRKIHCFLCLRNP